MPPRRYSNGGIARELTPERELIGWGHYFEDGNDDYFPGLPQIGVVPTHALVKDAWSRLGALFLEAYWRPTSKWDSDPWAWREFGPPPGWEGQLPPQASVDQVVHLHRKLYAKCGMRLGCDGGMD